MKKMMIAVSLVFVSMQVSAVDKQWIENLSAYKLIKTIDSNIPVRHAKLMKKTKIENLKVYENIMTFQMDKSQIHLTLIGSKEKVFILNGMAFSADELKDFKTIQESLVKKFSLKKPYYSLMNLLVDSALAETFLPFSTLPIEPTPSLQSSGSSFFNSGTAFTANNQPQTGGFGNFSGLLACLTGGCFQQRLFGISSFLESITQFAANDRSFNQFNQMPDPTLVPVPTFNASPFSVR